MNKMITPIQELEYSAGIMSQSFWFIEFKKLVRLIASGKSDEEIKTECVDNNLFGAPKEYRAKRMYGYLWKRAQMLDDDLVQLFMDGDLAAQKLINLIAILRGDRLFFEFVYEVYREKSIIGQLELEDKDLNVFFSTKGNQSDLVENWNESTKKHLKSNYTGFLGEAGMLRIEKKKRTITTPIVDDRLARYLERCGNHALLVAIMGVA